jgi:hypothetical protein
MERGLGVRSREGVYPTHRANALERHLQLKARLVAAAVELIPEDVVIVGLHLEPMARLEPIEAATYLIALRSE